MYWCSFPSLSLSFSSPELYPISSPPSPPPPPLSTPGVCLARPVSDLDNSSTAPGPAGPGRPAGATLPAQLLPSGLCADVWHGSRGGCEGGACHRLLPADQGLCVCVCVCVCVRVYVNAFVHAQHISLAPHYHHMSYVHVCVATPSLLPPSLPPSLTHSLTPFPPSLHTHARSLSTQLHARVCYLSLQVETLQ